MMKKSIQSISIALLLALETIASPLQVFGVQSTVSENTSVESIVSENTTESELQEREERVEVVEVEIEQKDTFPTIKYSGVDGDLSWSIDSNGHLLIEGDGGYKRFSKPQWLEYCTEIQSAEVKVTNIALANSMFENCKNMKEIDLSGFDAAKLKMTTYMFKGCSSLTSIDFSRTSFSSEIAMAGEMFEGCTNLKTLNMPGFNLATDIRDGMYDDMFTGCDSLEQLSMRGAHFEYFYPEKKRTEIFKECKNLKSIDLSGASFEYCDLATIFPNWKKIEKINLSKATFKDVNMANLFYECSELSEINFSGVRVENVYDMDYMFYGCSNLTSLDMSGFDTSCVTNMESMFRGCSSLQKLDVSNFNTEKVTSMESMFLGCSSLENLDVSHFNAKSVMAIEAMFMGCGKIKSLDLSSMNIEKVSSVKSLFANCSSLTKIDLGSWKADKLTSMESMFEGCSGLVSLEISTLGSGNVIEMSKLFSGCANLKNIKFVDFVTHNVTNMEAMFKDCRNLEEIDISNFVTDKVMSMEFIFSGCDNLQTVNMPKAIKDDVQLPSTPGYIWTDSSGTMCMAVTKNLPTAMKYVKKNCIDIATASIAAIPVQEYTGSAVTPLPVVTYQDVELVNGQDFVVSYADNINPGTANIVITGLGKYTGSTVVTFEIKVKSLKKAEIGTLEYKYKKGNLGKLSSKTFYSLYLDFEPVEYATQYEIELTDNKGKKVQSVKVDCANKSYVEKTIKNLSGNLYGIRMRALYGNIVGTWSDKAYVIKQPRAQARSYKGNVQVKWEKISGATGYDIYMSASRNGTYKKVASAGKNKSLVTIKKYNKKKLQSKTYYYYVVAKKKVGKKTYKSTKNFVYKVKNKK